MVDLSKPSNPLARPHSFKVLPDNQLVIIIETSPKMKYLLRKDTIELVASP